jgi:aminoglycoside phosphotransferase (APT) family kinase protein
MHSPDMLSVDMTQLASILDDLGVSRPVALAELTGGSAPVFRIDLAGGNAVVLKTYDDVRHRMPGREVHTSRLLSGLDIPITRYLVLDQTRTRLPFRFAITNYLPGQTVDTLKHEPDIADVYREMGALLWKLHSVPMPAYGHFDENGLVAPVATNTEFLHGLVDDAFRQFRRCGGGDTLATQLEEIVATRLERVSWSRGPVFAHDDVHPGNVLAARDATGKLRLTGLIDFGNARAADAVFDLAKNIFNTEHMAPGSTASILEGYGPIDHPDPEGALWLYTLVHRMTMWRWLRHIGVVAEGEPHGLIEDLRRMVSAAQEPRR